jgi:hypothetical protein
MLLGSKLDIRKKPKSGVLKIMSTHTQSDPIEGLFDKEGYFYRQLKFAARSYSNVPEDLRWKIGKDSN